MTRRVAAAALVAVAAMLVTAPSADAATKCFGKRATIEGTNDRDRIRGTKKDDVIAGLGRSDRLAGRAGNDLMCGAAGHDRVAGGAGDDSLSGSGGFNLLIGGDGNVEMRGGRRDDGMFGGPGNDLMSAGGGDDSLFGAAGDDLYDGEEGAFDTAIFEGAPMGVTVDLDVATPQVTGDGTDTVLAVEGLVGTEFADTLRGHDAASGTGDGLFGLAGDDTLQGRDGNDFLGGEDGDDSLDAGPGDDVLDGGPSLTGPPDGDFGDGGTHLIGDQCVSLEDSATTGCESFPGRRAAMSSAARWPA